MCGFDAEPCDFYDTERGEVARGRRCSVCSFRIPRGGPYLRVAWKYEDSFASAVLCFACDEALQRFGDSHGQQPTPDWFVRALRECVDVPRRMFKDRDVREWRDVIAGILRRRRAAS